MEKKHFDINLSPYTKKVLGDLSIVTSRSNGREAAARSSLVTMGADEIKAFDAIQLQCDTPGTRIGTSFIAGFIEEIVRVINIPIDELLAKIKLVNADHDSASNLHTIKLIGV